MKRNKVIISKKLEEELKKVVDGVKVGVAASFRDELTQEAQRALELFYADYAPVPGSVRTDYPWEYYEPDGVPKDYKRHYTNILLNSFSKYYRNPHGGIVKGGVNLSPMHMIDYYKKVDKIDVFMAVYQGIHGMPSVKNEIPRMKPSPLEIITMKRSKMMEELGFYAVQAYRERVMKEHFSTIKCRERGVKIGRY